MLDPPLTQPQRNQVMGSLAARIRGLGFRLQLFPPLQLLHELRLDLRAAGLVGAEGVGRLGAMRAGHEG